MIGTAVVVLLFVALLARPWVRAMRDLHRRRGEARGWGKASNEPPTGTEGEALVLRGRLEADGPIAHMRGPDAIAATLFGSPSGDGHLQAEGLRLRMGDVAIPIEGRVEVRVGADEEHPRSVPEKVEYHFAQSKTGTVPKDGEKPPKRAQLRRIASGDPVVVRGHVERRASEGGQYREGAHDWILVTGKHGEPIEVAAESPASVSFPRSNWVLRALGVGFLVFVLLPLGLEHGGEKVADRGNDTLRDCDPSGHSWLRAAEWMARAESAFPGFGDAGLKRRARSLGGAVNGVRVCRMNQLVPVEWVEPLIDWAERTLPAITESEYYDSDRNELESTLHEAGLDRAIVALQEKLPRGGEVTERVRAHLYLGDLEGAVETWREPGAYARLIGDASLQKGVVLCMAGHHSQAMAAFEEQLDDPNLVDYRRKDVLFRAGTCAIRADDLETAENMADALTEFEYPNPHQVDLRARIALVRDERIASEAPTLPIPRFAEGRLVTSLVAAIQIADGVDSTASSLQDWHELLLHLKSSQDLNYRFRGAHDADSSLFNPIYTPPFHEPALEQLAERILEGARALEEREAAAAADSNPSVVTDTTSREPPASEQLRQWAGWIHRYRAVLLGRRWDPRAEEALDAAEEILGTREVQSWRESLAFFHGDWESTRDAEDPEIRNLSRIYLGERPEEGFHLDLRNNDIGLVMLNPSDMEAEHEIAGLYNASRYSNDARWAAMRDQKQTVRVPVLFYRLTHVITHGENLGMDVSAHREQLDRLRAMVGLQPDPYLFMGAEGESDL
ncbi:MAG: hypothetical protein JJ863_35710 [Deltaproteobacteria bacterium]|nr:hypothetical protein [Deltaproteobacteria bacterium]